MSIIEIIKSNSELTGSVIVQVSLSDLHDFAKYCIESAKQETPEKEETEVYMTPQQLAETLQVSLVTLWSWDKKGITRPLRIGNAKRYRKSDLEKILEDTNTAK